MGVDPEVGSSALRLWMAAGSAALLVTACALAFARSKTTPLQALERASFIVIAAALGGIIAWSFLDRSAGHDNDADRRALIGPPRRAGIEQMDAVVHLIRGTVRVTEQNPVAVVRHAPG